MRHPQPPPGYFFQILAVFVAIVGLMLGHFEILLTVLFFIIGNYLYEKKQREKYEKKRKEELREQIIEEIKFYEENREKKLANIAWLKKRNLHPSSEDRKSIKYLESTIEELKSKL